MPPQVVGPHGYKSLQKQLNTKKRDKKTLFANNFSYKRQMSISITRTSDADSQDSHHKVTFTM